MGTIVSGGGFDFQVESVYGSWSWRVRTNNLQGVGQLYEVTNVTTPFGPLFNTQIPIPGDVIAAMAQSILDLQNQLSPFLYVVPPSALSFNLLITEGDPNQAIGITEIQNAGDFGSFMTATATSSVSWLSATPGFVQGIGKNEKAEFSLSLLTATLLESGSPYSGVINLQDNRNPPTVIPVTVTVTVLPRPVISVTPAQIDLTYIVLTSTPGGSQSITIENAGPVGSILNFDVAKVSGGSTWLDITPTSGGPLESGNTDQITFSIVVSKAPSAPTVLQETVRISSSNASNNPVDIIVRLTAT